MDISVILITYNNYTLKSGCIETVLLAIQNQICKSFEIIIVDNSSSEADTTKLKNFISSIECPKIKYISNEVKFIKYIHKTGNLYIISFNDNLYFRFNIIDSGKQEDITKGIFSSEILNTQRTSNEIRIEVNDDRLFVFSLL